MFDMNAFYKVCVVCMHGFSSLPAEFCSQKSEILSCNFQNSALKFQNSASKVGNSAIDILYYSWRDTVY